MTKAKRLLIIECIPKNQKCNEGELLQEFLRMTQPKSIRCKRITSRNQFVLYLKHKGDLGKFDYVHISAHGHPESKELEVPRGYVSIEDFPEGCFSGQTVALSACGMFKSAFIKEFKERTQAANVIAPANPILFIDASVWFVNFYYLVLHHEYQARGAFNRTQQIMRGKVKGGFKFS